MNPLTNTGYGTLPERMREVSMELPFPMPTSGSLIMPVKEIFEAGQKVGNLIYLHDVERKHKYVRLARFRCNCGNEFNTAINRVKFGTTKSCGCLHINAVTTHGLSGTRMWNRYIAMIKRCYDFKCPQYLGYGERGITVFNEWRNDIVKYRDYIMSLPNADNSLTIDRIDNDGNYEPGNLRWADMRVQTINQRPRGGTSKYVGVHRKQYKDGSVKWVAMIQVKSEQTRIGQYTSEKDALKARNNYIIENELWEYPIQKA